MAACLAFQEEGRKSVKYLSSQLSKTSLCSEGFSRCLWLFAWFCKEKGRKLLEYLSSQLNLCSDSFSPLFMAGGMSEQLLVMLTK